MEIWMVMGAQFLLFFALHFVIWRFGKTAMQGVKRLLAIALLTEVAVLIFFQPIIPWSEHIFVSGPSFSLIVMLYLHFYVGMDRSVSIRILIELQESLAKSLTKEQLAVIYDPHTMVKHRIDLLFANRYFLAMRGPVTLSSKALLLAKVSYWAQKQLRLKHSG
jgi:hypothetical protein